MKTKDGKNTFFYTDDEGKQQEIVNPKTARTRMTAYLSEDDGKTFPHKLLLCDDGQISYPSVTLDEDGAMLIVYDQGRGTIGQHAIFLSKITEEDILAGELTSDGSFLNTIVSRPSDQGGWAARRGYAVNVFPDPALPIYKNSSSRILAASCYGFSRSIRRRAN